MKNRLFYFAACVALVLSSVSCSSDDGEEEDADIPVVGKIAVSGAYNVYSHGSQGWIEADKIGIYVLSDGKAQDNLPYASALVTGRSAETLVRCAYKVWRPEAPPVSRIFIISVRAYLGISSKSRLPIDRLLALYGHSAGEAVFC